MTREDTLTEQVLRTYLLGTLRLDQLTALQQHLVDEVLRGQPACLVLNESEPIATVGRQGSYRHFRPWDLPLDNPPWPVKWVNRGGGCWLQVPGQLCFSAIVPLVRRGLTLGRYLSGLRRMLARAIQTSEVAAEWAGDGINLLVEGRPIAALGVAVQRDITYCGGIVNVNPELEQFRSVRTGLQAQPMTSLQRASRKPVRPSQLRERLVACFCDEFDFSQPLWFSDHLLLKRKAVFSAITARR